MIPGQYLEKKLLHDPRREILPDALTATETEPQHTPPICRRRHGLKPLRVEHLPVYLRLARAVLLRIPDRTLRVQPRPVNDAVGTSLNAVAANVDVRACVFRKREPDGRAQAARFETSVLEECVGSPDVILNGARVRPCFFEFARILQDLCSKLRLHSLVDGKVDEKESEDCRGHIEVGKQNLID